jgi:4-amino-4-deoxy-L-arabinose transferase-like glycosyltransferase
VIDPAPAGRAGRGLLLLLLTGTVIIGAGIGLRDPWAPDEPRYVLIARDMLASGEWLFPSRGGELYPDKPPLYFWLLALALAATGSMRAAFLLPSLVASLVTLGLVYDLARRLWDARTALVAGLLLLLTVQFTQHAKAAQIDALLCMWTTLSLYALLRHVLLGPAWGWYCVAWLAAGMGIITKGVGFLGLFALLPCAFARVRGWPGIVRPDVAWRWLACAAAVLLPLAAWLVPMLHAVHASHAPALVAYRDDILLHQTVERYADAWGHRHPWWYFIAGVIPVFWLPVSALFPWLLPAWWRDLRVRDARMLLLLGVVVAIVVFFSLSTGKRGVYLLPALPPLALAAAPHVRDLLGRRSVQRLGLGLTGCTAAALFLFAAWLALGRAPASELAVDYGIAPGPVALVLATVATLWLAAGLRRGALAFAGMVASFWLVTSLWLFPALNPVRSAGRLMQAVERSLAASEALAIVGYKEQFLLHARRPVTHFGYRRADDDVELREAVAWLSAAPGRRLLVAGDRLRPCFREDGPELVGFATRHHWYLTRAGDLSGACRNGAPGRAVVYRAGAGPDHGI